jgi:hypothetical protein
MYAAAGNPRRTKIRTKKTIYGWTLNNFLWLASEDPFKKRSYIP